MRHSLEDKLRLLFLKSILSEGDHKTGRVERFYRPEKIDETSIVMKSSITGVL